MPVWRNVQYGEEGNKELLDIGIAETQCQSQARHSQYHYHDRVERVDTTTGRYLMLSSSSSSNTVQGSVLLPHYRTLEVRPGRIS